MQPTGTVSMSREEGRRIVHFLRRENRFRLMFGQPFFPGPDVDRYEEAMRGHVPETDFRNMREKKDQTNEPKIEGTI